MKLDGLQIVDDCLNVLRAEPILVLTREGALIPPSSVSCLPLRAAINRSADSAFTSDQHMAHVWYWHETD